MGDAGFVPLGDGGFVDAPEQSREKPKTDGGFVGPDGSVIREDRFVSNVVSFTPGACAGFGASERCGGRDVSIAAQGRILAELVEHWGLEEPAVAGHDIGGGIVLRAHLLEGVGFRRISLLDAVVLTPWGTPALGHVKENLGAYRTMPDEVFEAYVASRLMTATSRPMDAGVLESYLSRWRGPGGKEAYLRKDEALLLRDTAEVEPLLGTVGVPVRILWGGKDTWLDPSQAEALAARIPGSEVRIVSGAGHFVMEDEPGAVAEILADFFDG